MYSRLRHFMKTSNLFGMHFMINMLYISKFPILSSFGQAHMRSVGLQTKQGNNLTKSLRTIIIETDTWKVYNLIRMRSVCKISLIAKRIVLQMSRGIWKIFDSIFYKIILNIVDYSIQYCIKRRIERTLICICTSTKTCIIIIWI